VRIKVEKEFEKNMCFLPEMLTSDSSSILTKILRLVNLMCFYTNFFDMWQHRSFLVLRNLLQLCTSKEFHGTCVLVVAMYHITFSKYLFCKVRHSTPKKIGITGGRIGLLGRLAAKIFTANLFRFVFCKQATCVIISLMGSKIRFWMTCC
jgi:hypothetical protein